MKLFNILIIISKTLLVNFLLMLYIGVTVVVWKRYVVTDNWSLLIDLCSFILYAHYLFVIIIVYLQVFVPERVRRDFN